MYKALKEMTPEEEKAYIDNINDLFITYLPAAPFIEVGDTTGGQYTKLRTSIDEGRYSLGEIIFELQLKLYQYKKNHPELIDCKLIISDLQITSQLPDTAFRRGLMIKVKYDFKELPTKQKFIEGVYIEEVWIDFADFPEPPCEVQVPTLDSMNQWDAYKKQLRVFSEKYRTQNK